MHHCQKSAAAAGVVCVESKVWVRASDGQNHAIVDASIAATQMWLTAADIGLGSVWVADYNTELLPELFPEFEGCKIVAFMQTGYPAEDAKPIAWHTKNAAKMRFSDKQAAQTRGRAYVREKKEFESRPSTH